MIQQVAIIGAGGLGREVLALLQAMPEQYEPIGFFDDNIQSDKKIDGVAVLGSIKDLNTTKEPINVLIAIGDPVVKAKIYNAISNQLITYPIVIHPKAIIGRTTSVKIGQGSIITAGANLTIDIEIGMHVLINLNCTIGHNTRIKDFSSIMPAANLAGNVTIGKEVLIGSGANILNGVNIGDCAKIGSGAVVIDNIPASVTAVGVPAKVVK